MRNRLGPSPEMDWQPRKPTSSPSVSCHRHPQMRQPPHNPDWSSTKDCEALLIGSSDGAALEGYKFKTVHLVYQSARSSLNPSLRIAKALLHIYRPQPWRSSRWPWHLAGRCSQRQLTYFWSSFQVVRPAANIHECSLLFNPVKDVLYVRHISLLPIVTSSSPVSSPPSTFA